MASRRTMTDIASMRTGIIPPLLPFKFVITAFEHSTSLGDGGHKVLTHPVSSTESPASPFRDHPAWNSMRRTAGRLAKLHGRPESSATLGRSRLYRGSE